jgi:enoyl-CoA hydratase
MSTTQSAQRVFETIILARAGKVARLTLNRPDQLNAIDARMLSEIKIALDSLAADSGHRVCVIEGAGRSFCAGFDVRNYGGVGKGADHSAVDDYVDLEDRMRRLMAPWDHPLPVVAAVHGHCLAAASILAAFCDITIVADDAVIGLPSIPLGGGYITPTWVHLVGPKRAKQMSYVAGSQISGRQAASWGWANHSVPADRLAAEVTDLANAIALTPAGVLRIKKASINRMVELGGLRTGALLGAQGDALAHQDPGVDTIRAAVRRDGLKQAIQQFRDGALDV